ncbi:protein MMS22-like [Cylas formicarius]|uniref:protein MMS22-like n=1 Tax=Cylas formicarius TaxID=197179 RepID=UPI002958CC4E|nr:protein MMS22-like [Cylas formicarius]
MLNNILRCSLENPDELISNIHMVFSLNLSDVTNGELYIGTHLYEAIHVIEEIYVIMRLVRTKWCVIQNVIFSDNSFSIDEIISARSFINQALQATLKCLLLCNNSSRKENFVEDTLKSLKGFLSSVVSPNSLEDIVKIKIVSSQNVSCQFNEYFHALLEIQYYKMALYYICELSVADAETKFAKIMSDFLCFCKANFYKKERFSNIFVCNCMKHLWLMLELLVEKISPTPLFWKIFNNVLEQEDPLFALAMLKDVAFLHCFNSEFKDIGLASDRIEANHVLLELKVKELLDQADSEVLLKCLKIIEPLLLSLWIKVGRIEIYQTIWDFYSKRLNLSKKYSVTSALQLIENLDTILWNPTGCADDFEMFSGLLVAHLRQYPYHWAKVKGRIYSQLGPNKVRELSDVGITQVALLFLALSAVHFEEIEKKIMTFLENIPQEKKNTEVVWTIHGALILKYAREGRGVETVATPTVLMLHEAANQGAFTLIKGFIDCLEHVVANSASMSLGQWSIFGPWWPKYLSTCYYCDLEKALGIAAALADKCCDVDSRASWETTFKEVIYPSLKQLASGPIPPPSVGAIAAKLALAYVGLAGDAFAFFCGDAVSPGVASEFLRAVLDQFSHGCVIAPEHERLVARSWMKICLLTSEPQLAITLAATRLDVFPAAFKRLLRRVPPPRDPVHAFIEYLGSEPTRHPESAEALELCELCFGQLDESIARYLAKPDNEDVVFRVFDCVALAFKRCGMWLYCPNRSVSAFTRLVQTLVLPTSRRPPHAFVLNAVRRTWCVFFEAVIAFPRDDYLERTLRDLVVRYVPYFPAGDSPVADGLRDVGGIASTILDKMGVAYFTSPFKEFDANVSKVLQMVSDLVRDRPDAARLVAVKMLRSMFDVVVVGHASHKNAAVAAIKAVTESPGFAKSEFRTAVAGVTERYLGLNTVNYFQLMTCLARLAPSYIDELLPDVEAQIANVERIRGVGFDKTLRHHLQKLENALSTR